MAQDGDGSGVAASTRTRTIDLQQSSLSPASGLDARNTATARRPRYRRALAPALPVLARWAGGALAVAAIVALPFEEGDAALEMLSMCGVFALVAIPLTMLNGKAGQFSMALPAFMGAGAYVAAYFGAGKHFPFIAYAVIAIAIGAVLGLLTGLISNRLSGDALAITTLGILMLGLYVFNTWTSVTGGEAGVAVTGASTSLGFIDFGHIGGLTSAQSLFWFIWIFVAVVAWLSSQAVAFRPGRAMQAIHDTPRAAEAIGVDIRRTKVQVATFAGGVAALAGVLYGIIQQFVAPTAFSIDTSIMVFAMIVIGGAGRVSGAVIGAVIVWCFQQYVARGGQYPVLDMLINPAGDGRFTPGAFDDLVYGLLIVLMLMYTPNGLMSLWDVLVRFTMRLASRVSAQRS